MKEFPDDELDKLFRKSAEELDSNFDPQDWNALKNRLDENDGRTPTAWLKKWWPTGMLALLMLGGLTTYLLTKEKENVDKTVVGKENQFPESGVLNKKQNKEIAEKSENVTSNTKAAGLENNPEKLNNNTFESKPETDFSKEEKVRVAGSETVEADKSKKSENDVALLSTKSNRISKSENRKTLPRRWSKTGGVYLAPNHSIGRRGDGASLSENGVNQKGENLVKSDVEKIKSDKLNYEIQNPGSSDNAGNVKNNFPIVGNEEKNVEKLDVNNEFSRLNISAGELKSRSLIWKKLNMLPKIEIKEADVPPVSKPVKAVSEKEPTPKFAVRFSYSPDISSVGLKNFTKPGTAVSLLIEYAVLRKLYIQTGVTRSSKVYNAKAGEYEWPSTWNDQKVLPTSVDAVCKIIEIPLNVRYDISQSARSRWFTGAGISSYYMQNEKYNYNYPANTPWQKWQQSEASTGWYWLSHINASAGYEYRVSKKISLLAEPYVRIPVKKVGFGKVDLFTTGVWFSIRYTPLFKK